MSYQTKDEAVESAAPLLLFEFNTGGTISRLTASTSSVQATVNGTLRTWSPAVIVPSEFGQSNDIAKDALTIKIAKDSAFAADFLDYAPDAVTTLTVFRAFYNEPESLLYWKGSVSTFDTDDEGLIFECVSEFARLKRQGVRAIYLSTCRHVLYSDACGLDKTNYDLVQKVYECNGDRVRVNAFCGRPGYWVGGSLITSTGVERTILEHKTSQSGDWLKLSRPIKSLSLAVAAAAPNGVDVTLYRGCDHTFTTCKARGNKGNFGGWPWWRRRNPFTVSIVT